MTDEELIAKARWLTSTMWASASDRERLAAGVLRELADRLEGRAATQATEDNHE